MAQATPVKRDIPSPIYWSAATTYRHELDVIQTSSTATVSISSASGSFVDPHTMDWPWSMAAAPAGFGRSIVIATARAAQPRD